MHLILMLLKRSLTVLSFNLFQIPLFRISEKYSVSVEITSEILSQEISSHTFAKLECVVTKLTGLWRKTE